MLIIDSPLKASSTCTADTNFLICTSSAAGDNVAVSVPQKFFFGIYWANPGYSATAAFDGFFTIADFSIKTPSNIATTTTTPDFLTVVSSASALVAGSN